jgi:hypothetical protein
MRSTGSVASLEKMKNVKFGSNNLRGRIIWKNKTHLAG